MSEVHVRGADQALEALLFGSTCASKTVTVTCDRCNKPLGALGYLWGEIGQVVLIDIGMAVLLEMPFAAQNNWLPVETPGQQGRRKRPYVVACPDNGRWRYKAVCLGGRGPGQRRGALDRHQPREATVKAETVEKAYTAAIDARRSRITTYELETAGSRSTSSTSRR